MIRRLAGLPPAQLFLVVVAVAVAVGTLAVSVSVLGNVGMLLASAGMLAALAVLAQWLWQSRQATDWDNTFRDAATPRGGDSRITRLASDLREAESGAPGPTARLHATLSSLATERLRSHPTSTGESILGRELAAYLAGPPTTRLTAAQLAAFTTTLEDLS